MGNVSWYFMTLRFRGGILSWRLVKTVGGWTIWEVQMVPLSMDKG